MTMVSDICARQVAAVATTAAGQQLDLVSSIPKASSAWAFENREVSRRNEALIWPLTGGDNNNAFCCYFLGVLVAFSCLYWLKTELTCLEGNEDDGQEGSVLWYCSSTGVHFISKITFVSPLLPSPACLEQFCWWLRGTEVGARQLECNWESQAVF